MPAGDGARTSWEESHPGHTRERIILFLHGELGLSSILPDFLRFRGPHL
jgi:hypothetical protein